MFLNDYRSDFVKMIKSGTHFYRARIVPEEDYGDSKKGIGYTPNGNFCGYNWEESKEPPSNKRKEGRNNTKDEDALYLASDEMTACLEIRPGIRQVISVGEFILNEDIEILDFSPKNGFGTLLNVYDDKYNMDIRHFISEVLFFFSQPVYENGNKEKNIYKVTQYICKHYRTKHGFKGIAYRSFYGDGINYTFFDDYRSKFVMLQNGRLLINYAVANLLISLDSEGSNKDINNFNEKIAERPTEEIRNGMRSDFKYLIDQGKK